MRDKKLEALILEAVEGSKIPLSDYTSKEHDNSTTSNITHKDEYEDMYHSGYGDVIHHDQNHALIEFNDDYTAYHGKHKQPDGTFKYSNVSLFDGDIDYGDYDSNHEDIPSKNNIKKAVSHSVDEDNNHLNETEKAFLKKTISKHVINNYHDE